MLQPLEKKVLLEQKIILIHMLETRNDLVDMKCETI